MAIEIKYVIFDYIFPVIFINSLEHTIIAAAFKNMKATSAGYVKILSENNNNFKVITYSKSIGLNLKPKPGDAQIIKNLLERY